MHLPLMEVTRNCWGHSLTLKFQPVWPEDCNSDYCSTFDYCIWHFMVAENKKSLHISFVACIDPCCLFSRRCCRLWWWQKSGRKKLWSASKRGRVLQIGWWVLLVVREAEVATSVISTSLMSFLQLIFKHLALACLAFSLKNKTTKNKKLIFKKTWTKSKFKIITCWIPIIIKFL